MIPNRYSSNRSVREHLRPRLALRWQQVRWVRPEELGNYAFPAANARIIEALLGSLGRSDQAEGTCDAA